VWCILHVPRVAWSEIKGRPCLYLVTLLMSFGVQVTFFRPDVRAHAGIGALRRETESGEVLTRH